MQTPAGLTIRREERQGTVASATIVRLRLAGVLATRADRRARQAQVTPGHETGEDSAPASLGSSPRSEANGEHHIKHPHAHKAKKGIKKLGQKIKKAFNPNAHGEAAPGTA